MKLPRIPFPQSRRGRIGASLGVAAALVVGGVAIQARDTLDSVEEIPFDPEVAAGVTSTTATEAVRAQFRELEPYETLTPEELAAALAEAEAMGRLIGDGFTVPEGVGRPLPDEMFDSYLLIGSDASARRADVLIYLIKPTDGSDPLVVSIPRDLYFELPCTDDLGRINSMLNGCGDEVNGPTLVALAVERFTGIAVDHFGSVDFAGFEELVDTFGGVELCFDRPTRDIKSKLDAPEGCHTADGKEVLAFVRSRRPEELIDGEWVRQTASDFTRQDHQQEVIWQIAETVGSFESVEELALIAGAIQNSLALDSRWTFFEATQTAYDFAQLSIADVTKLELELEDYRTSTGAAVLVPTVTFTEILEQAYPAAAQ